MPPSPSDTPSDLFEPPLDEWPAGGVYQLWLHLNAELRVRVGGLGRCRFPAGRYIYTGRAKRGLRARVMRYVRGPDRLHWHIDYLVARSEVTVERVVLASSVAEEECQVNRQVEDGRCLVRGFGATDCREGCTTHLWAVDVYSRD